MLLVSSLLGLAGSCDCLRRRLRQQKRPRRRSRMRIKPTAPTETPILNLLL